VFKRENYTVEKKLQMLLCRLHNFSIGSQDV